MLQAFFAAIEIALLSCNRVLIRNLADQQHKRAQWVDQFLKKPVNYLSTTMIGVNVSVVVNSAFATHLANMFLPHDFAPVAATLMLWPFILLFGEFIPMSLALAFPFQISLWGIAGLKAVYFVFYPFIQCVAWISNIVNRLAGGKEDMANPYFTREELKLLFKGIQTGTLDHGEERMIRGVFEFHKARVDQIMVPIKRVVSCSSTANVGQLKKIIFDSAYSRIPIYSRIPTNIVGTVHAMDLMGESDDVSVEKIMRSPIKFSQGRSAVEILRVMWGHQIYMAIIMGSHDKSVGIVTLEDILEEIVGEIDDEYESRKKTPAA